MKHAWFGFGIEHIILLATGLENIRDVIWFLRNPGKANMALLKVGKVCEGAAGRVALGSRLESAGLTAASRKCVGS